MSEQTACSQSDCYETAVDDGLCQECRDELVCRSEGCGELTDDGEGFDGFCADRLEAEGHWD